MRIAALVFFSIFLGLGFLSRQTFSAEITKVIIGVDAPAGNTADVILIPGGYTCRYAAGGQLLEVPADVMSLAQAQEAFFAAPLGGQTCDGKLYGFPAEYNLEYGGAYVNPALFEEAGLTYPPQWKSWDDVVTDAEKLTKVGADGVMTDEPSRLKNVLVQRGQWVS